MNPKDLIETLNDLIETSKDGEEGFRACAENATDPQLKTFFLTRAQTCAHAARELQEQVLNLGGQPETDSGTAATLHRRWVDVKSAIMGRDDLSILEECERGEDAAVQSYRKALEKDLPTGLRETIDRQCQGAVRNHDQVRALRERARSAKSA